MNDEQPRRVDHFDRIIGSIDGLPDVQRARPSTVTTVMPIIGQSQTYVVQSYKEPADERAGGFYIFLQRVDAEGGIRIAIPPKVADAIYRQRDALVKASRRQTGRNRWAQMSHTEREHAVNRLRKPKVTVIDNPADASHADVDRQA